MAEHDPLLFATKLGLLEIAFGTVAGKSGGQQDGVNPETQALLQEIRHNLDRLRQFQRQKPFERQAGWDRLADLHMENLARMLRFQFPDTKQAEDLN